jgi:hypothetical protein
LRPFLPSFLGLSAFAAAGAVSFFVFSSAMTLHQGFRQERGV